MVLRQLSVGSLLVTQILRLMILPTYEFKCPQCEITVDKSFAVYSNHSMFCEDCGVKMAKVFSSPGVIFKGDGWAGKSK